MRTYFRSRLFASSLIVLLYVGLMPLKVAGNESSRIKFSCEQVEQVSRDEVHAKLRVVNTSDKAVYLLGINFDKPNPYPILLEQWREGKGWQTVAPCVDVPPPHVITLGPGKSMVVAFVLKLPLPSVCKERALHLEGRFRYQLNYFHSKKEAQTYMKKMFSTDAPQPTTAVTEPFEIPIKTE